MVIRNLSNFLEEVFINYRFLAIILGLSLPSMVFGKVVFAFLVLFALILLFCLRPWEEMLNELVIQAKSPLGKLILFTFLMWLPSVFISSQPIRSFEAIMRTLAFIAVASVFCSSLKANPLLLDLSLQAFTGMAFISVIFALSTMMFIPELFWVLRLKGWQSEEIFTSLKGFSNLTVMVLPLLILVANRLSGFWKTVAIITFFGFLCVMWENYNRSAIAGLLASTIAVGFLYFLRYKTDKAGLLGFFSIALALTIVIGWLWVNRGGLPELIEIAATSPKDRWAFPLWLVDFERQVIWESAVKFGLVSPWFGIGPNTINFVPGADSTIVNTNNLHIIPSHPHNWVIEVFAETGIFGLCALIGTVSFSVFKAISSWYRQSNMGFIIAIGVMAGYWGSGLFNFSYWSAWWQMSFFLSLSFCYCHGDSSRK